MMGFSIGKRRAAPGLLTGARRDHARPCRTIRFQLLVAVNAALAVLALVFSASDYRRELVERMQEKRIALDEEAKTLLPAVLLMRRQGADQVQRYVDAVCGRMRDADSPGHHIAVQMGAQTWQASAHHRASPAMLRAMQAAGQSPERLAPLGETELVVGMHRQGGLTVYVSEYLSNLHRTVVRDALRRLLAVIALAVVAGGVINIVLLRVVTRPLEQLVTTVRAIGRGGLGTQARRFRSAELSYLANEINAMSRSLAAADRDRAAQMEKARQIQQQLLPNHVQTPGLTVAHLFQPADDVGGDYYDILPLPDGTWLFCVADVTGHGVPAAMNAAILKTILLQATEQLTCPAQMLTFINQRFMALNPVDDFVSMLLVRASASTRTLQYASAGHETAWLLSPNGSRRTLPSTGLLLGIDLGAAWEKQSLAVTSRERLLMLTDGITEALSARRECFGRQRPVELIASWGGLALEEAAQRIHDTLEAHRAGAPQYDDITLLLVEFA